MSLADRISSIVGGVPIVGAPARALFDLATAPWRDNEELNGFSTTLRTVTSNFGKDLVRPFGAALNAITTVNREVIREPLTTAFLVNELANPLEGGKMSLFDKDTWQTAYRGAQEISFGQAAMASRTNPIALLAIGGSVAAGDGIPRFAQGSFDIFDAQHREEAFKQSLWGRIPSGAIDTAAQIVGDVTLVGGKISKAARLSQRGYRAIAAEDGVGAAAREFAQNFRSTARTSPYAIRNAEDAAQAAALIARAEAGETNRWTPVLQQLSEGDALYARSLPWIAEADNAGVLSYYLGMSKTGTDLTPGLVLRAALSDQAAMAEIATKRAAVQQSLSNAMGQLDLVEAQGITKTADAISGQMDLFEYGVSEDALKAIQAEIDDLTKNERFFNQMFMLGEDGPSLRRTTGGLTNRRQDFVARGQVARFYDRKPADANVEVFQPTTAHRLYQKITWAGNERPAGWVDFNDQDSYREIVANVNDARRILGPSMTDENARGLLQTYNMASTPEARSRAALAIEESIFNRVAAKYGYTPEEAGAIYSEAVRKRKSLVDQIKTQKFGVLEDGSVIDVPLFRSQNANFGTIMDFGLVDQLLKRSKTRLQFAAKLRDDGVMLAHEVNDIFKAAALARLGYTIRNGVDSQLRIAAALGGMASLANTTEGLRNFVTNTAGRIKSARAIDDFQPMRAGMRDIRVVTEGGQEIVAEGPTAGTIGAIFRQKASSEAAFARLATDNQDEYLSRLKITGYGIVKPDAPNYWDEFARVMSDQLGSGDQLAAKVLEGQTVPNIVKWMRTTPEGRDYMRAMDLDPLDVQEHVLRAWKLIDYALPQGVTDAVRAKLLNKTAITADDLKAAFSEFEEEALPVIHGQVMQASIRNLNVRLDRLASRAIFKVLGSLPEDFMASHPLYNRLVRDDFERRINILEGLKKAKGESTTITADEINRVLMASRRYGERELKRILYRVERRSTLATKMGLLAPFIAAQENAVRTWFRLASNDPSLVNKAAVIWNAPNRSGMVTDEEGNLVDDPTKMVYDGTMWFSVPKGLQQAIPGLRSLNEVGVQKASLDIIFGGTGPFALPVGPYVAYPVSEIVKKKPQYEDVLRWAIPFGPTEGLIDSFVPAWVKRQITRQMEENSPEYARFYNLIWTTEQYAVKDPNSPRFGEKPPTASEVKAMVDAFYNMRTFANLLLPVSPQFNSPYRFYFDQWRKYQRQYGIEADEKWLADYGPDFFPFATSLSKNRTGINASVDAVQRSQQYADLIAELNQAEPALVGLITNNPSGYEFSTAAYDYQYDTRIAPGSAETFRGMNNPLEAQRLNQAKLGWIQYRNVMNLIDAELASRGLTSLRVKGAEDLKAIKDALVMRLAVDENGNPTPWYEDYRDTDGSKSMRIVRGLNQILSNEKFMAENGNNPTWKSVALYMELREQFARELATRESASLSAQSNQDLAILWDAMVGKLKQDDIGFADLHDRFLSQDMVYDRFLGVAA